MVLVIIGTWLAVGRDSGPGGDAQACARVLQQTQSLSVTLDATSKDDWNYNEAVGNYRTALAKAAGSEWPNVENEDLKAVLQRIAAAPVTQAIYGDAAAVNTLCKKA